MLPYLPVILAILSYLGLGASVARAERVPVGAIIDLTGSNAPNGEACRQGLSLAFSQAGVSERLRLILGDHRGEVPAALNEFRKQVDEQGVPVVVAQRSQIGMALNPIAKQRKIPLVGIVGHALYLEQNQYAFRSYPSTNIEGRILAEAAFADGHRKVVSVTMEDEWTLSFEAAFAETFERKGGTILERHHVQPTDTDLTPIVMRAGAAKPDAILVNMNIPLIAAAVRRIRERGISAALMGNNWGASKEAIEAAGSKNMEGFLYSSVNMEKPRFRAKLEQLFPNAKPIGVTYSCYAAIEAISQAVLDAPDASAESIHRSLGAISKLKLLDEELAVVGKDIQFDVRAFVVKDGSAGAAH